MGASVVFVNERISVFGGWIEVPDRPGADGVSDTWIWTSEEATD